VRFWQLLDIDGEHFAVGSPCRSPVGRYLGFTRLRSLYWSILAVTLACYLLLTQGVKSWLLRRRWI